MDEIPASEFDGRDFDAREVVQRYRKRVPLPQLQRGLRAHHAATRQELIELINDKYADFVSLSSRMQGVERALKPLRAPLEESSELTQGLHTKLGAILQQAEEAHNALARTRAQKDALMAYIENAKLLEKAKVAASKCWGNPQESHDLLREHVAQENIARDIRRIQLNLGGKLFSKRKAESAAAPPPPPPPRVASKPTTPLAAGALKESLAPAAEGGAEGAAAAAAAPAAGITTEETSPECQALLQQAYDFEAEFATKLREKLHVLVYAAKRAWEAPGGADAGGTPGPPSAADLLPIAHLCRALATVGRIEVVEEIFAEAFVKSALGTAEARCTEAAEESQRKGAAGTSGSGVLCVSVGAIDLGPFFDAVRSATLVEGAPILWFARRLRGGDDDKDVESALLVVPSLFLVARAVVAPALQYVQQVWPSTFMPAFPDIFASNYVHAAKFIAAAQDVMTPAESQRFAASSTLSEFQKLWKTQVYYSLRRKEAEHRLEDAAKAIANRQQEGLQTARRVAGHDFWFPVSVEVVSLLELLWSDGWYLDAIFAKMARLSLELLVRYSRAVQVLVESGDGMPGWDANAPQAAWSDTSGPAHLARIAADVRSMLAAHRCAAEGPAEAAGHLARMLLLRLPAGASGRPRELVCELFKETATGFQPVLDALDASMLKQVTAATVPQFGAIRSIPAVYRMLNKPVPTKASPYVEAATRPLEALRDVAAKFAPVDAASRWLQQATDAAAQEFSSQAAQLLESTHQQEASLRRLGNRGGSGDSQVSDLDKIHIQLCVDVETFKASVAALGVDVAQTPGLERLATVVAPVMPTYAAHQPAPG